MKPNDPGTVAAVTLPPKPFTTVVAMLEGGQFQNDATDALRDLCVALSEHHEKHGKAKGRITLTVDFNMEDGIIEATGDVAVKAPKLKREKSIFWLGPNNELTQQNPKQLNMALREVPTRSEEPPRAVPDSVTATTSKA